MGAGLEGALGIQADRNIFILRIYMPRKSTSDRIDPLNDISNDSIRTAASFVIQQDFDNKYAVTNIDFVRRALRLDSNQYTQVEVSLKDPSAVNQVQEELVKLMGSEFKILTRYQQNQSLYSVINMERWIIYGVLCLILVVAAFNMIGALTMLVLEKQKDISVLHALGGSRQFIQRIFLSEGLLLAAIGTVGGMLLAVLLVYLQVRFHLIPLEGDSFLIDYFPVKMRLTDFALVGVTVFIIALLAAWLPSRKAGHAVELRSE
jgi:lipoprotein-releasing system permease protein